MRKELAFLLGLGGAAWLSYMVWLTGYQTGYEAGEEAAWSRARRPPQEAAVVQLHALPDESAMESPSEK